MLSGAPLDGVSLSGVPLDGVSLSGVPRRLAVRSAFSLSKRVIRITCCPRFFMASTIPAICSAVFPAP